MYTPSVGTSPAKGSYLTEKQTQCLCRYLRHLLDLYDYEHFRVWYADLLYHLGTKNLDLASDVTYVVWGKCPSGGDGGHYVNICER